MMTWLNTLISIAFGGGIAFVVMTQRQQAQNARRETTVTEVLERAIRAETNMQATESNLKVCLAERDQYQKALQTAAEKEGKLTADVQMERDRVATIKEQLTAQKQWVIEQTQSFESKVLIAATKVMEDRGRILNEASGKELQTIVKPFKDQLDDFRKRIDDIYTADTRERSALHTQIVQLTNLNQTISAQADRLTNALTVTAKSTGDWGETILHKILEDSGLREGHEYRLQHSVADGEGNNRQPDAILFLPDDRQLVVDSKVSNRAWTEYCNAADDDAKKALLREHLTAIRRHVKDLAGKDYSSLPSLKTVDFVVMFVPVEAALLTAFAADEGLYTEAFRSKVILVTPSTLMAVVKMVEGLWKLQKQQESAAEIAETGRKLYEKLVIFAESFVEVGQSIEKSQAIFEKAKLQLSTGRANAIRLASRMVDLGVQPSGTKRLPAGLLAGDDAGEYEASHDI
jgi:DNA recombination protein RmuC